MPFRPPTEKELFEFIVQNLQENVDTFDGKGWTERRVRTEIQKYLAHYGSQGWKVGKNPMKDWESAARGWMLRADEGNGQKVNEYPGGDRKRTYP